MRRALLSLAIAGTFTIAAAPAVLGHECYIANRSEAGNTGALNSNQWERITLADIFGFINGIVGGPALSPSQVAWAVDTAVGAGLPADGWVVMGTKTIGEGSANPNLANGKGLDHLADTYGPQIVGIYLQALNH